MAFKKVISEAEFKVKISFIEDPHVDDNELLSVEFIYEDDEGKPISKTITKELYSDADIIRHFIHDYNINIDKLGLKKRSKLELK